MFNALHHNTLAALQIGKLLCTTHKISSWLLASRFSANTLIHFAGEIKARTEKWLADPAYRLPAGAAVDDLFSDILNEADECAMLRSTWEEEFLRAEGEKCLAKLRQKGQ